MITVQTLGGEHMRLDQQMERSEHRGACADLVGERGQADLHAFAGIAVTLAVERLMRSELLEHDHCQEARPEHHARRRMERCRRLGHCLARAAREPLAHCLDHLPLARDHLKRLGHVLADPFLLEDQLTDEDKMIRDVARGYAQDRLQPRVI